MSLTVTKTKRGRPMGPACCFVFGYRLGTGCPMGPTPSPRPRRAQAVVPHRVALCGGLRQSPHRPRADRRQRPCQRRGRQRVNLSVSAKAGGRPSPIVRLAGARRCTWPCTIANSKWSPNCSCTAPTWPSRTATGTTALRRTAASAQGHAEATRRATRPARGVRGGGEAGAVCVRGVLTLGSYQL